MISSCRVCASQYESKYRGWYDQFIAPVCSSTCFLRLCREGYPEIRDLEVRYQGITAFRRSDRSLRSGYETTFLEYLHKVHCEFRYEPYSFTFSNRSRYVPDFYLYSRVFVEVKGLWTVEGKKKFRLFKDEFPDVPNFVADKQFIDLMRRTS
jgi:hypothetical protein